MLLHQQFEWPNAGQFQLFGTLASTRFSNFGICTFSSVLLYINTTFGNKSNDKREILESGLDKPKSNKYQLQKWYINLFQLLKAKFLI